MWTALTGQPVNGVIAIDVVGVRQLLEATGPVVVNGQEVSADNVGQYLLHDQYESLTDNAADAGDREDALGSLAKAVISQLQGQSLDLTALADSMSGAVAGRHLMVWSANPSTEAAWQAAGVGGGLTSRSVAVSLVNLGSNKLDPYVPVHVAVGTSPEGADTSVTLTVTAHNTTPPGQSQFIAGPSPGSSLPYGAYSGVVATNVPGSAMHVTMNGVPSLAVDGPDGPTRVVGALGHHPGRGHLHRRRALRHARPPWLDAARAVCSSAARGMAGGRRHGERQFHGRHHLVGGLTPLSPSSPPALVAPPDPSHQGVVGHVGEDDGIGPDPGPVADAYGAEHLGSGSDAHVVPDLRLSLTATGVAKGHSLVEHEVATGHDFVAHHDARGVDDGESGAELGRGMDLGAARADGTGLQPQGDRSQSVVPAPGRHPVRDTHPEPGVEQAGAPRRVPTPGTVTRPRTRSCAGGPRSAPPPSSVFHAVTAGPRIARRRFIHSRPSTPALRARSAARSPDLCADRLPG